MRILLIHNKYQQKGGEDVVFGAEGELMASHGHTVERLLFDNSQIKSAKDVILSGIGSVYNVQSANRVDAVIRFFQPDIIHVHNFFPLASPAVFFVAAKFGVPVIVTLHNYRLICPSYSLYYDGKIYEKSIHKVFPIDAILKGVYRESKIQTASTVLMTGIHKLTGTWKNKVDRYIVLTEFAKNKFLDSSLQVPTEQLIVKPNFTDDLGIGEEQRENFFLFIGRLTGEKGIQTVLDAAATGKFTLKIIGDGPLKETVESYAARYPNILYAGFQQKPFIISELKKCRALVFPSVWYEGFPMTILEAFSTGTPVITSKLGGMAEIVDDLQNGLHFLPGNSADLVDKIQVLSADAKLSIQLGKQARQDYLDKYTPEKNYTLLLSIYEQAIAAKKHKQPA
ncbi:glycosyltransferase family 4 protein [Rhodocytophaga rosea]|uniref:Glycosyltransferase family 4 protein n=1 Tax=Rhodocytophaga rosea TaxID=2704465 RepID=A0A6C0GTW9_9BACT|nr:glycosyltransferase family 4 protein [Rhodocytophaga rosea]QHT71625.1 glycosyltransferase family 4 protein [Rhodocytophaga rosea]